MLKLKSWSKLEKKNLGFMNANYLIWLQLQFCKTVFNFQEVIHIPVLDTNTESQKLKGLKETDFTVLIAG